MSNCIYNNHAIAEVHIIKPCDAEAYIIDIDIPNENNHTDDKNIIANEVQISNNDNNLEEIRQESYIDYLKSIFTKEKWDKKRNFYREAINSLNGSSLFIHRLKKIYYNFMILCHNEKIRLILYSIKMVISLPFIIFIIVSCHAINMIYCAIVISVFILFHIIAICIRPFTYIVEYFTKYRFPTFVISRHLIRSPDSFGPCPNNVRVNIFQIENLFQPISDESINVIETIVSIQK